MTRPSPPPPTTAPWGSAAAPSAPCPAWSPPTPLPPPGPSTEPNRTEEGGGGGSSGDAEQHRYPLHIAPRLIAAHSGFRCPICSKAVASDEMEMHFIMCLSKPRLSYNDDVLTRDAGECVICLEELSQGDTIARLPCLCIYHKSCIDSWFEVNRCCPEHPSD
ncbi:unnamed protein product [Staurois parvus]|uniref:E3 ubiquitin-protein ligase ZNRF1 n=1 Tax=Staurois parvus TaxID=386267 RepID=A0ABN9H8Y1_9NEOB|nr:unnamed protein product [Staurois parvus]